MAEEKTQKSEPTASKDARSSVAKREEEILKYWQDNNIFEKTLEKDAPAGEFVFYEGPPTANGKPGIHHLESRAFKDAIPRYKTMRGFHVRRKAGWDTHGLPVEIEVEKELGFKGKKDIEEYGVEAFNKKCRASVMKYVDEWNRFTNRIGYWVDREDAYFTFNPSFMESVWNVISKAHDRKLLYKDYKVLPWCPRCGTALSSHEVADGYKDVKDLSVTAKFELVDESGTYVLAWTTTPWTLPGNVALAVGSGIEYVKAEVDGEKIIVAEDLLEKVSGDKQAKILETFKGEKLIGLSYKPLYPYLAGLLPASEKEKLDKAYQIYPADFVTTEDGTGVVHTAVMYGQDDFVLGTEIGLPKHHLVSDDGKFVEGTGFLTGRFVRDEDVAVDIIKDLAHRSPGLLFSKEKYEHTYPHCWRCKTALIYYARDSWYIRMSELRDTLVKENQEINWEPAHIRDGRFGEWLREVKDWAISRERYWGTPLPVWNCEECDEMKVIGSVEELKESSKKSGNRYFAIRHGESEANSNGHTISTDPRLKDGLTPEGRKQVVESVKQLKKEKITKIIASPFVRTAESAEILATDLGLSKEDIIFDERLGEWQVGEGWQGREWKDVHETRKILVNPFTDSLSGGESLLDVRKRCLGFIYEVDKEHKDETILIVAHSGIVKTLITGVEHPEERFIIESLKNAEFQKIEFSPLPHNDDYELDLHKPYIDEVELECSCGGVMKRVLEVMDVWLDSGSMPFAQDHYPFENKEWIDVAGYPADYISEAIDQTRGWFYTLHAVGAIMEKGKAYKNVISLGHLLDAEGKKMSKSVGNIVEPWGQIEKYGVDILRFWMYTVNQPGESKNYDEKTVQEMQRKVMGLLSNVIRFYEMYADSDSQPTTSNLKATHVLDRWIIAKLDELIKLCTDSLNGYKLLEPGRAIREFIDEFSTWYIRRSRDRFKSEDKKDREDAIATTHFVLLELSKLMAPFMPFFAEDMYMNLKGSAESVHLEKWPELSSSSQELGANILEDMREVREIVSHALEQRSSAGIKVRQPLSTLRVRNLESRILNQEDLIKLIKDEVNVKEVVADESITESIELTLELTPELLKEGDARELTRQIQDMRKKAGLTPDQKVSLTVETDEAGQALVEEFADEIKKTTLLENIKFTEVPDGEEIKIGDSSYKLRII
jgi:isoleucyl-tRNA synthetase